MSLENQKNKLIAFIREEIGEFNKEINFSTRLEEDLGVTGDEAVELLLSIGKEFKIDLTGFDFKRYFHPEPSIHAYYSKIEPLTVQNLLDAIKFGKFIQ